MVGGASGGAELTYPRGQVLANSGNVTQLLIVKPTDRVGPGGNRLARRSIRPDFESVLAFDLEQVGDLAEHLRDGAVIHAPARAARRCSREAGHRRQPGPRRSRRAVPADRSRTDIRLRRRRIPWRRLRRPWWPGRSAARLPVS